MLSFFTKKDFWGNGLAVWVLAALLFALPFLGSALKKTEMNNEVEAWLPDRDPQAVLLSWYNQNFPIQDRLFLSWGGSSLNDPRVELLAAKLEGYIDEKGVERRGSPYILEVLTPHESLSQMVNQKIDVATGTESLSGLLIGHGPLKVRLSEAARPYRATVESLIVQELHSALKLEASTLPAYESWHPPAEFAPLAKIRQRKLVVEPEAELEEDEESSTLQWSVAPHDFQVTWHLIKPQSELTRSVKKHLAGLRLEQLPGEPLIEETFFEAGSPVSLVVTLSEAGEADRETALQDIIQIAGQCFISETDLHMGGRPVGSAQLNEEVRKASFNPDAPWYAKSVMGLSALVSFALALVMVRSFKLGLIILAVSLYTTLITVSLIPMTGRTMNMVLIVMPTLLSVITLSGAIHMVTYWKHATLDDPKTAVVNSVRMAAEPCSLSLITSAIGLISLMTSVLNPVRDFGIYSAIGCGVALVFILVVLPSFLQLWPAKVRPESSFTDRLWTQIGFFLTRNSTPVVMIWLGLFAVGIYGMQYFRTETKIVRSFPPDSRLITDYWFLEDQVVGVNTVDTIIRFNEQSQNEMQFLERLEVVRQITNKIRQHEEITGSVSLADFQGSHQKPAENARFLEKVGYNKRSNELESRMKSGEIKAANAFFTMMKNDHDWLEPGDKLLGKKGDELWRISSQAYVMADNDYGLLMEELDEISGSVLSAHPGTSHSVTGMVPVFLRTQEALLESLIWSFGMSFVLIALMMMFLVRSFTAGLLSMLPNLIPVTFCFGVMSLMRISVDIGTMITASVGLALAVDGTIHQLAWFKAGVRAGLSRSESIRRGLTHCAPATWQTGTIVALSMLMLAPSSLLMISRFGALMSALVMAAMLADIILLPALLKGWMGDLIERREHRRLKSEARKSATSQTPQAATLLESVASVASNLTANLETLEGKNSVAVAGPHHASMKSVRKNETEAH